ncbi:MAG: TonB C-terminal domain-containing protein [bacterium]
MMSATAPDRLSMRAPVALSVVVHVAAAATFLVVRTTPHPPMAPIYSVSLVAAPAGARQVGVVQPAPPVAETPKPVPPAPTPLARETPEPARMKAPAKTAKVPPRAPKTATPNATQASATPAAAAPVAGGGPQGGKGADVANVKADGIAFPYPVYLQNIVRQIALNFRPSAHGALTAEVAFMIRRDGTVAGVRLTKRSSVYSFDQDALAAIELASRAFGPLPQGFSDDVLPVIFSFDPRLIR